MKQAQKFLEKKNQVRIVLSLKGRQKNNTESAIQFLMHLHENYLNDFGKCAKLPSENGLFLTYNPR